jgi:hypothetical protein
MSRSVKAHRSANDSYTALTSRLVSEYRGILPPGTVMRCVARCREQLRRAGVRAGLEHAVEAMARYRLRELQAVRASG